MDLNKILLYRITHINNLDYIFDIGKLTCPNHPKKDPNYINIGDISLIQKRGNKKIYLPPGRAFIDYVSFYFGPRSPMLYVVANGFNNVPKQDQEDIIYMVSSYKKIKGYGLNYVFFNGHGFDTLSEIFNNDEGLNYIDWDAVHTQSWSDTEEDPDIKRRKQAELLVFNELAIQCLLGIGCYSEEVKIKILKKINEKNLNFVCEVRKEWYY